MWTPREGASSSSCGFRCAETMIRILIVTVALSACGGPQPPPRPTPRDPSILALDRLLGGSGRRGGMLARGELQHCLQQVDTLQLCSVDRQRTLRVRVALDPRYTTQWPDWEERLARTFACVNTLYASTGLQWDASPITPWDPGAQRHDLYRLLDRLQLDLPADGQSVALGITVWDERRVFAGAGGEIGLSQRAACVVPSWPRVENDCLILAHELGHLVGARHVPGEHWIMGWAAHPFHLPARDPLARVTALYRFHPRNRQTIIMHRLARFTPHGLRLPERCERRRRAMDRCYNF